MTVARKPRAKVAYLFFGLSALCKGAGKLVIGKSIVVDVLTLPGWFVIDECLVHQSMIPHPKLKNAFEWKSWPMPTCWCEKMKQLKES